MHKAVEAVAGGVMARRKRKSFWAPHRVAARVVFGSERNQPHPLRWLKRKVTMTEVVSVRRDPKTGVVHARGGRRTEDGWQITKSRRKRTYRPGEVDKPRRTRSANSKTRADKRKTDRAARSPRKPAAKPEAKNPNLARKSKRNADGTMAGSIEGLSKMPTPRKAVGLQRLGCAWCRGKGVRPLTVGKGRVRTVIGVANCSHSWAVPNNGPGQDAPDRRDSLVCPPCENKGTVPVVARRADGVEVKAEVPCTTCKGWILHW